MLFGDGLAHCIPRFQGNEGHDIDYAAESETVKAGLANRISLWPGLHDKGCT
jgi:hypothetical protein